jgi:membrane protein implicated in regulation of membrane protease activity
MVEFSLGIVICLWQIYSLIYITYFALLNTQLNLFNYLLHFVAFAVGVALIRNASHRAQKRYIDALVGKKSN